MSNVNNSDSEIKSTKHLFFCIQDVLLYTGDGDIKDDIRNEVFIYI